MQRKLDYVLERFARRGHPHALKIEAEAPRAHIIPLEYLTLNVDIISTLYRLEGTPPRFACYYALYPGSCHKHC